MKKPSVWDHVVCILFGHKYHDQGIPYLIGKDFCCWRCGFRWRDG